MTACTRAGPRSGTRRSRANGTLPALRAALAAEPWLRDYCLYMAVKEEQGGAPWYAWPQPLRDREAAALAAALERLDDRVLLHAYLQTEFTRQWDAVRAYAHAHGVVVEAELGKLAGVEDEVNVDAAHATYTDPDQAVDFVKRTGVDSLAIAIGTSHGAYKFKGEAKLDFDRLATITEKLEAAGFHNYPIVLHGASSVDQRCVAMCNEYGGNIAGAKGIPAEMLRKASSMAVCKINMDTDLRLAMTAAVRKSFGDEPAAFDPRGYLGAGRALIQELVEDKIKNVIGSTDSMN